MIKALGPADACNVNMVIHGDDSPVPESEIEARLPATRPQCGQDGAIACRWGWLRMGT